MNMQVTEQASQGPSVEERAADLLFGSLERKAAAPAPKAPEPAQPPTGVEEEASPQTDELSEGDTDAATEAEAPIADETFEFEHEGTKYALPKALEKAVANNRDYTQKSQELANQRRLADVANEQARAFQMTRDFEASVAAEMRQLAAYDEVLSQPMDPNQPQEALLQQMVQRNQWEKQREAIAKSVNGKHQQYKAEYDKALGDMKAKATEAVAKRVPGWSDAMWTSIREHAKSDGYTDSELSAIADPRHQITLWKAQQYDQLKTKATKAVAEVKAVKTSPSHPMPQAVKDKLNFRKQLAKAQTPQERSKLAEARAGAMFAKR